MRSLRLFLPAICLAGTASVFAEEAEVVVTATALNKSPFEATQPVAVLQGEALIQARALSLGETLASQPGLSASYYGPQASRPLIRGQGGERVQIYTDGFDALDVSALSNDHAVTIDPLLAERIEVVRGPATLLYGNGASAGIINMITDRIPQQAVEQGLTGGFELRGNTALEERAGVVHLTGGIENWAWHADGHIRETDDVRIPGRGRSRLENTASETYGAAAGTSWVGERGFAGVGISHFDTQYGITNAGEEGVFIDMQQTRYDFGGDLRELGEFITTAHWRTSFNNYTHAEVEPTGEVGTRFDQDGIDGRLSFDHQLAGWRGNAGVQYRTVDLQAVGEEAFLPASETENTGYFVFEEKPLGAVTLEVAARLEQQKITLDDSALGDYDRDSVSGSAGAIWKFKPDYALALNVTSTERHPTVTELFANGPHVAVQRFEIGDANLKRERANTVDLSLRRNLANFGGSLTLFYSDYARFIFPALTGAFAGEEDELLPVIEYQQADARFSGFEAELSLPRAQVLGGEFASRIIADYVRAKLQDGGDLPLIPPLRVGAEVDLSRGALRTGLSVMYYDTQNKLGPNELPTDSYTMVDVDVSYRLPGDGAETLLFVRGSNLLDEEARRHSSPLKDFAPLPGRSFGAGVRVSF
jgi:iron complex outermembrane recepter protein